MNKIGIAVSALALAASVVGVAAAHDRGGRFKGLDANEDGVVTRAELDAHSAALVEAADADGDGGVSNEEMRAYREAKREERRAKHNPDTNGDGVVDRIEFQAAAEKRFARMDKNDDGVLSEDERQRRRGRHHRRHHDGDRGE